MPYIDNVSEIEQLNQLNHAYVFNAIKCFYNVRRIL